MIIDLPDPIEGGPAYRLFTGEFYRTVYDRLTDNGIIAVQAGSASPTELLNLTAVHKTLETVFPLVQAFATYMPCFGGSWGFTIASKGPDVAGMTPAEVDARIVERGLGTMKHYDGITHRGMFAQPLYIRRAVAAQTRIITDDTPLYLYGT
jgi:spermidine synthase